MARFDFAAPADLFCTRSMSRKSRVTYRRFESAAEAIRFAVEQLDKELLRSTTLEVDEDRLTGDAISRLYQRPDYPLTRKVAA
jgi:hypothetical protein